MVVEIIICLVGIIVVGLLFFLNVGIATLIGTLAYQLGTHLYDSGERWLYRNSSDSLNRV